ncbi:30S ribosomal protein S4 [Mycobacteroides abscessus subsp. abscessus]|nr:30S ribosomal protein S4 [Mycobacteroides abscessus subsp. abscessus]
MLISQRPTLSEETLAENRSRFVIEPLEPGFGYTLGNSLRRTLLSSIPGAAVTSIRIDGVLHEFTTVPGVKEDVTDIILNLKSLVVSSEEDEPVTMYLRKQGPGQILESRLDNVVYRAGLARTRRMARQLVSHGHFTVNNVKVDVPSYRVSQYDIIDIKPKSLNTLPFEVARETAGERPVPGWLQVVGERQRILVHQLPERAQIDVPLAEQLIVEFYSK